MGEPAWIAAVDYNDQNQIEEVLYLKGRIQLDVDEWEVLTREQIVRLLNPEEAEPPDIRTFVFLDWTIERGAKVHDVNKKWISTNPNEKTRDNLAHLGPIDRAKRHLEMVKRIAQRWREQEAKQP